MCPARKVLGVSNKENIDCIFLPVCHSAKHLTAENKPTDRTLSNTGHTVVKKSSRNLGSRSSPTLPFQIKTVNSRISLGPLVKTKTGLVPALTQPSQTLTQRHTSFKDINRPSSVVNKFKTSDSTSVTVSKGPTILGNKKRSVLKSLDAESTTVSSMTGAKITVQGQNKASSNLHLDKTNGLSKSQQTNQRKSISNLYKCTNRANKHEGRMPSKTTTQPTNESKNPKSDVKVKGNRQQHIGPSRTSLTGVVHRSKDEQGQKNRMATKKDEMVGWGSVNVQLQRRTIVARPTQAVNFTNQTRSSKVKFPDTVIPCTDGKRKTAAQAERM